MERHTKPNLALKISPQFFLKSFNPCENMSHLLHIPLNSNHYKYYATYSNFSQNLLSMKYKITHKQFPLRL